MGIIVIMDCYKMHKYDSTRTTHPLLMLCVESLRAVVERQLEVLLGGGEDGFVLRWRSEDRDR